MAREEIAVEIEFFNDKDGSSTTANCLFDVSTAYEYGGYHGNWDGFAVTSCNLLGQLFNGYLLPRTELVKMFGAEAVHRTEDMQAEAFQEQLNNGDLVAAE